MIRKIIEKTKGISAGFLGVVFLITIFITGGLLIILLIEGGVWLSAILYPWLLRIFGITFGISLFILLPLSGFRRTRLISAIGLLIASYIFGATLWTWSFLLAYLLWGFLGLLIGLFFFGFGVVPVAMLATLINVEWEILTQLIILVVLTYGVRILSLYLKEKVVEDDYFNSRKIITFPTSEDDAGEGIEISDHKKNEDLYCNICDTKISNDSTYCSNCGIKIKP